jgi:hypothetical protein
VRWGRVFFRFSITSGVLREVLGRSMFPQHHRGAREFAVERFDRRAVYGHLV